MKRVAYVAANSLTVAGEDPLHPPTPPPAPPPSHLVCIFFSFFFFFFGLRSLNVWAKTGVQQCRVSQRQVEALESSKLFFFQTSSAAPDCCYSAVSTFARPGREPLNVYSLVRRRRLRGLWGAVSWSAAPEAKSWSHPWAAWDRYQPIHHSWQSRLRTFIL